LGNTLIELKHKLSINIVVSDENIDGRGAEVEAAGEVTNSGLRIEVVLLSNGSRAIDKNNDVRLRARTCTKAVGRGSICVSRNVLVGDIVENVVSAVSPQSAANDTAVEPNVGDSARNHGLKVSTTIIGRQSR